MGEIRKLGNVQFGEVVATALKERWSGVLTIENPEFTEYVSFQGGSIAGFSSAERKKLIGEILMAGGHIEQTDLEKAVAQQKAQAVNIPLFQESYTERKKPCAVFSSGFSLEALCW